MYISRSYEQPVSMDVRAAETIFNILREAAHGGLKDWSLVNDQPGTWSTLYTVRSNPFREGRRCVVLLIVRSGWLLRTPGFEPPTSGSFVPEAYHYTKDKLH